MSQISFSDAEQMHKKRKTRRERFLERMNKLIPWETLETLIEPFYHRKATGRPPYPLKVMLRVHAMQLFYNLSDPAMEDALYEIASMRTFAGLTLSGALPDETTILNFRHLLEKHGLSQKLFESINEELRHQGLLLQQGTLVDASILSAPTSTKNSKGERDPEMHQTKKGNQWYFGMKMHIGADESKGVVHTLEVTPANVHDVTVSAKLLHGQESRVFGDAGYSGIAKRKEHLNRFVEWFIALRPGQRKALEQEDPRREEEKKKAGIRARVEHPFRYIKQVFGYNKTRYRGLQKNASRLYLLLGFANLLITEKWRPQQEGCA